MTWTDTSSPTRRAAAAPASVAALTAPTSPRTITVTYPAPMYSLPTRMTLAAFTMASAASIDPISPLVSTSRPVEVDHLRAEMRDADLGVLLDLEPEGPVEGDHRLRVLHRQGNMVERAN